ncbi:MAG TPA: hypothetical protein VG253_07465 [Streptosporangiaceae bacterium]|nr:hypothetical protein [Streptosporangiaceae bacterium]
MTAVSPSGGGWHEYQRAPAVPEAVPAGQARRLHGASRGCAENQQAGVACLAQEDLTGRSPAS